MQKCHFLWCGEQWDMFTYSCFSVGTIRSWECLTKTTGGHRPSIQTPGSCYQLHQMGLSQEQGHRPVALQIFSKACLIIYPLYTISSQSWFPKMKLGWNEVGTYAFCNTQVSHFVTILISPHLLQILFQIRNLLQAKYSTLFVPQSTVHFQCQSLTGPQMLIWVRQQLCYRNKYWTLKINEVFTALLTNYIPQNLWYFGSRGIDTQRSSLSSEGIPHYLRRGPLCSSHNFDLGPSHNTLV